MGELGDFSKKKKKEENVDFKAPKYHSLVGECKNREKKFAFSRNALSVCLAWSEKACRIAGSDLCVVFLKTFVFVLFYGT
jgi:hypothetical protein